MCLERVQLCLYEGGGALLQLRSMQGRLAGLRSG